MSFMVTPNGRQHERQLIKLCQAVAVLAVVAEWKMQCNVRSSSPGTYKWETRITRSLCIPPRHDGGDEMGEISATDTVLIYFPQTVHISSRRRGVVCGGLCGPTRTAV